MQIDLEYAIHMQSPRYDGWTPPVLLCSTTLDRNIPQIYNAIKDFKAKHVADIIRKRATQNVNSMWTYIFNITMSAYDILGIV